jgi:hypothetical protein
MKYTMLLLYCFFMGQILYSQSVGVGISNPDASAKLDITSDNSGLLVPRMTTVDRNRISNPAKGLLVYDSTSNNFWFYNGSLWNQVLSSNNVRFGFDLVQNSTLALSYNIPFVSNYNLDPSSVTLVNATTLQLQRQGLYHFSLIGVRHIENAASATATSGTYNLSITINGKQYRLIVNGAQVGGGSSWSYGTTTTLEFDVFVPANSQITVNASTTFNSGFIKSDNAYLLGYLISE